MATPTPGPWTLETLGDTLRIVSDKQAFDEFGDDVAVVGDPRSPQAVIDATFIASAPDQYDALKELSASIREHQKRDIDATHARVVRALCGADAALAKAEGRA